MMTRRSFLNRSALLAGRASLLPRVASLAGVSLSAGHLWSQRLKREFDPAKFGAVGDGVTDDTEALQKTVDAAGAAGAGSRVVLRGGKRYLSGTIHLQSRMEFHLADDTVLLASTEEARYADGSAGVLMADDAVGLVISGTGMMDGQAMKFMTGYSDKDQRWEPKAFRPRMFSLRSCKDLEVRELTFGKSPTWGLHMLGCERVLVDGIKIRNYMDVPNCDGMDPDRCRDVVIQRCDIVGADDAIVVKTSDQKMDYGVTRNVTVRDCMVITRDSGLKVGTETFGDISKVLFENCKVISGGRGPTITHRQAGNLEDIEFRDIEVVAQHHAPRWWGWGEPICVTVWPRTENGHTGTLKNVRFKRIKGRGENSVRIDGTAENPVRDVLLEDIDMTVDKWTAWPGGFFDNRPTGPNVPGLEEHKTPVYCLRHVTDVTMKNCTARWGEKREPYWSYALETVDVKGLKLEGFKGESAFPGTLPARG